MSTFRIERRPEPGNRYRYCLIVYGVNPEATNPAEQKQSAARAEIAYRDLAANPVTCAGVTFIP